MKSIVCFHLALLATSILWVSCSGPASDKKVQNKQEAGQVRELFIPDTVFMVPEHNDYKCDTSEFCFARMKQTDNIALFWAREYGDDPMANPDTNKRFNPDLLLAESERIFNYYLSELKFMKQGHSVSDKSKQLIYIFGGKEGTAFGGGEGQKVGIFWAPAIRMRKAPFGALAHEMGHSFQYLLDIDKSNSGDTTLQQGVGNYSFVEMTSQFLLWQVYPEWMTFENYHLVDYLKQTHLAFLHERNMYHSAYPLEYWADKHGKTIIGRIWQESKKGEDPVLTYQRLTGINQAAFNDEMFDAARRFITWDLKRIEKVAQPYANQHSCKMLPPAEGWYRIDPSRCPENYGYNGIKLRVPAAGTKIKLWFKGLAGAEGYRAVDIENAGWRYGFLAVKRNGERVYSKPFAQPEGEVSFKVPAQTEFLWLVVSGAPIKHSPHQVDGNPENDEQWPYQIKLEGTEPDDSVLL